MPHTLYICIGVNLLEHCSRNPRFLDPYSLLELDVPVWNSGLTNDHVSQIERIQKMCLAIIRGDKYTSYEEALMTTGIKRLSDRRKQICLKFVTKNIESESSMFQRVSKSYDTRSDRTMVKEVQCRTKSYFDSSIPYLARLFNENLKTFKKLKNDSF